MSKETKKATKKVKDILYNDYRTVKKVNAKMRYGLGVYYITDYGFVFGKHVIPYVEQFAVLSDDIELEYLTNVVINGNEFYMSDKGIALTGFESEYDKEKDLYHVIANKLDKETQELISPEGVYFKHYPREYVTEFKPMCYKILDKLDLFRLRALNYVELTEDQKDDFGSQNAVEIVVDGYPLIFDNSLFPAFNKPDFVPEIGIALIPNELLSDSGIPVNDETSYFILRNTWNLFTTYTVVKTLNV